MVNTVSTVDEDDPLYAIARGLRGGLTPGGCKGSVVPTPPSGWAILIESNLSHGYINFLMVRFRGDEVVLDAPHRAPYTRWRNPNVGCWEYCRGLPVGYYLADPGFPGLLAAEIRRRLEVALATIGK